MENNSFEIDKANVLEVMDFNKVNSVFVTTRGDVFLTSAKNICMSECNRLNLEYREVKRSEISDKKAKSESGEGRIVKGTTEKTIAPVAEGDQLNNDVPPVVTAQVAPTPPVAPTPAAAKPTAVKPVAKTKAPGKKKPAAKAAPKAPAAAPVVSEVKSEKTGDNAANTPE